MLVHSPRPSRAAQEILLPKVLFVEGDSEGHFFESLSKSIGMDNEIEIRMYHGIANMQNSLAALVRGSGFAKNVLGLGIVRDADDNPQAARDATNSAITTANVPAHVRTSIFIVPDANSAGMLETLWIRSIENAPLFDCVRAFEASVDKLGTSMPPLPVRAKNLTQAYFATGLDAQTPPGIAASRAVPLESTSFDELKQFLREIYTPPSTE